MNRHTRYNRSPAGRARLHKYQRSAKYKAVKARYQRSAKGKATEQRYLTSKNGIIMRYWITKNPARLLLDRLRAQERRGNIRDHIGRTRPLSRS